VFVRFLGVGKAQIWGQPLWLSKPQPIKRNIVI